MINLIRLPALQAATGYPRSTIYLRIKQGLLPPPVKLGERAVAWNSAEVNAINSARLRNASDDEIRALVAKLESERTAKV